MKSFEQLVTSVLDYEHTVLCLVVAFTVALHLLVASTPSLMEKSFSAKAASIWSARLSTFVRDLNNTPRKTTTTIF